MESASSSAPSQDSQREPATNRLLQAIRGQIFVVSDLFSRVLGDHERYAGPLYRDEEWGKKAVFLQRAEEIAPGRWFTWGIRPLADTVAGRKPDALTLHNVEVASPSAQTPRINLRDLWAEEEANIEAKGWPQPTWNEPAVVVELKKIASPSESNLDDARDRCLRYLLELLRQPGRRFAIVLSIINGQFRLFVGSASGVFVSPVVDAREDPKLAGHVLSRIPELAPSEYGINLDMCKVERRVPTHPVHHLVPGFSVVKTLRFREDIVGRCLTVFRLEPTVHETGTGTDDSLVLKMAFLDEQRKTTTESTVLQAIAKAMRTDPGLAAGLAYPVDSPSLQQQRWKTCEALKMSEGDFRQLQSELDDGPAPVVRELSAVLIRPVGISCTHYKSASHFWRGIVAAVKAHRNLYRLGYLHRDVSTGNIILPTDPEASQSGHLIDYDLTTKVDDPPSGSDQRTGTYPFIAIDLLLEPTARHEVRHDLESFFYVVFWVCCLYGDPADPPPKPGLTEDRLVHASLLPVTLRKSAGWKTDLDQRKIVSCNWNHSPAFASAGSKNVAIQNDKAFQLLVEQVDPFWRKLVDGQIFHGLRNAVVKLNSASPGTVDDQYNAFLAALEQGLRVLESQQ